jgi:hypothetical protein
MHNPRAEFPVPDLFSLSRVAAMGTDVEMNQARVIFIQGIIVHHLISYIVNKDLYL